MFNATQFQHKCVVVTGASRGIGKAVLSAFAKQGAIVIGTATTQAGVAAIETTLLEYGAAGAGFVLNLNAPDSREQTASLWAEVSKQFGAPLILVNNAGMTRDNLVLRMKDTQWDEVLGTHLSSAFYLSKLALRGMLKARWGRILQMGSVVASMGNAGQANYCAAKAGLLGLTKALAKEVGARGITVNVIAPGFIETDMTKELGGEQQEALFSAIPCGRFGKASEVASLALFLATEEAGYIQGQTVHINGGMWMA